MGTRTAIFRPLTPPSIRFMHARLKMNATIMHQRGWKQNASNVWTLLLQFSRNFFTNSGWDVQLRTFAIQTTKANMHEKHQGREHAPEAQSKTRAAWLRLLFWYWLRLLAAVVPSIRCLGRWSEYPSQVSVRKTCRQRKCKDGPRRQWTKCDGTFMSFQFYAPRDIKGIIPQIFWILENFKNQQFWWFVAVSLRYDKQAIG